MAKQFDLIVFDWDGTLMDSASAIVTAIQAACQDLGLTVPSDRQARYVIGFGLADALQHAVPDLPQERVTEMVERYRHHYLSQDHELTLFDGIPELMAELQDAGYALAVATGKSRLGLNRALAMSGLESIFHATRCADECHSKPHPQMLLELMDEFAVPPERTLMIGDTTHDLQMADNAGVGAIGVTYGAHVPEELKAQGPLAVVDAVEELGAWLRRHG